MKRKFIYTIERNYNNETFGFISDPYTGLKEYVDTITVQFYGNDAFFMVADKLENIVKTETKRDMCEWIDFV